MLKYSCDTILIFLRLYKCDFTAKWSIKTSEITFDANGGSVAETTKTVEYGDVYGTLPTPERDYYTFDGWYTEVEGGEKITADTVAPKNAETTVFAHWTLNEVQECPVSSLPEGSAIVGRRYVYTRRDYTTSGQSSMAGWTHYNTTFAYSEYGAWSAWQNSPVYNSEFINTQTQQVIGSYQQKLQYRYSRYLNYDGSLGKA